MSSDRFIDRVGFAFTCSWNYDKKDSKILTLIRQNQMFSLIERIIVGMSIPLTYPEKITVTSAFLSRDFCFDIPFAANLCLPVDSILNIEGFNPLLTN